MNETHTLLDLAKLNGTDSTQGVLELGQQSTPEIALIPGNTIAGHEFTLPVRTKKPKAGFRKVNEGQERGKSEHDFYPVSCHVAGYALEVDKALADVHPFGRSSFLASEEAGAGMSMNEGISEQIYYGTAADQKGFLGYQQFLTNDAGAIISDLVVDAGGDNANQELTSAYLVAVGGNHGVNFVYGGNGAINDQDAWDTQRVNDANGKMYTAYQKSVEFWIGLQLAPYSVVRIANIKTVESATDGWLTDHLIAKAVKRFPRGFRPSHIFCNKDAKFTLQQARSAVIVNPNDKVRTGIGNAQWAPEPTESNGLPVIETDGLRSDEAVAA